MKPRFRCSSLPRIFGCNGSIVLNEIVEQRKGDEGHEGSFIHHQIASRAITELGAVGPENGLPSPNIPDGYKLPPASAWIIGWAVQHLAETVPHGWSLQVEVELEYEFQNFILTGHQDWLAISPDGKQAIGGDWKSGQKPVEPALTNDQMLGYLVLNALTWPDIETIEIQVCQPRADEDSGFERVSSVTLDGENLINAPIVLAKRMEAAIDNRMELNTGLTQCAWCIGCSCPAIRAEIENMKLTMTEEMLAQIKATPDDAILGDFVVSSKTVEKAIEDAREMIIERLKTQGTLHSGSGVRIAMKTQGGKFKVVNPQGAWNAVNELVPPEKMAEVVTYFKTRLVDVIAEARGIPKSSVRGESGESLFSGYIGTHMQQGEKNILIFSYAS